MKKQASCEDRIEEQLNRTVAEMEYAVEPAVCMDCEHVIRWDEWNGKLVCPECESDNVEMSRDHNEDTIQEWREGCLGVEIIMVAKVQLSWGGPADFFKVELDSDGYTAQSGTYHFQDWFDGAERKVGPNVLELLDELVYFDGAGE